MVRVVGEMSMCVRCDDVRGVDVARVKLWRRRVGDVLNGSHTSHFDTLHKTILMIITTKHGTIDET